MEENNKTIIDKTKAVRTIVKNLDDLLEKSEFEKIEERKEVTSWAEDLGTDEFLKGGLGEIYEHKTKDCKFVVNFFLDQERFFSEKYKNFTDLNYIELNLYLNGELIGKDCEYIERLHECFEEPFGSGYSKIWGGKEIPIGLHGGPDIGNRFDVEGWYDVYSKPVGYKESKVGYDIAFERILFGVEEWIPHEIASAINDAREVLLDLIEEDIEISKKGEKKTLEERIDCYKIDGRRNVIDIIRKRNEQFYGDVNERYKYFCKKNAVECIHRMNKLILPRDILNHIFQNAENYDADELQFEIDEKNLSVYMIKGQEKIAMLEELSLQQYPFPTSEKVMEELKKVCGFYFGEIKHKSKASIILDAKKYLAEKFLIETLQGEKVIIKFF